MSKHAIAMCDILGFSDLVQEKPLDSVVQDHLGWLRKAAHHSVHKGEFPSELPSLRALRDQSHLGIAWFSDTILIYTLEDTDENVRALTSSLGWLLFETMLEVDTRLRCGVSYGEAFIDAENSIYVGQPLIEAHRLEQSQEWSGGALTREVVEHLPADVRAGKYRDWFLVPYSVPLKDGKTLETLAVNWTIGAHRDLELPWSQTHATPPKEEWENEKRRDICEKWQNTKLFHERVCKFCRH
ncbi:MAG TPA: hypothetical protein G4O11_11070 [Anaerolineae bacterium]|nr:hypothetical protein [Anaerolineae bacterium]